ncbi:hypothetical protein SPLC1_S531520 [Arthrospira platensis C1]|nr:hypothetical protein SPLC1_S531520 [Arthrospira platensis C1]
MFQLLKLLPLADKFNHKIELHLVAYPQKEIKWVSRV